MQLYPVLLTDKQVKSFQPTGKDQWHSDGNGLRLLIKPNGSKYWRLNYRHLGKQKTFAIGVYPDISLKAARTERDKARMKLQEGVDPASERKATKRKQLFGEAEKFSTLASQWLENKKGKWTEKHAQVIESRLIKDCYPYLDVKPVTEIQTVDVLHVIKAIEARGALDVASRVLQSVTQIFRYGVQISLLQYNPATELQGVVKTFKSKHRDSLPTDQLGRFLRELEDYHQQGRLLTQLAIQLLVLTFVRPGELRGARWQEFDLENALRNGPHFSDSGLRNILDRFMLL